MNLNLGNTLIATTTIAVSIWMFCVLDGYYKLWIIPILIFGGIQTYAYSQK